MRFIGHCPAEKAEKAVKALDTPTLGGGRTPVYVVNPWQFLDSQGGFGDDAPPDTLAQRMFGRIIQIGSLLPEGKRAADHFRCWRHRRDRFTRQWTRCDGRLALTRDDVGRYPDDPRPGIWWVCTSCWFTGVVESWQGTPWDMNSAA